MRLVCGGVQTQDLIKSHTHSPHQFSDPQTGEKLYYQDSPIGVRVLNCIFRTLLNSFHEATITLMPKPDNDIMGKKKNDGPIPQMNTEAIILNKTLAN